MTVATQLNKQINKEANKQSIKIQRLKYVYIFRPSELDVRRKIVSLVGQHFRFVNSVLDKYSFLPSGDSIKIFLKKIKVKVFKLVTMALFLLQN